MPLVIKDAAHAARVIDAMTPEKFDMVVAGLLATHPDCVNATDDQVRTWLKRFVAENKDG